LRTLLPKAAKRGRPPVCRQWILNAILYGNRTGCQWRSLPHDFPKWKTVYTIFWRWRQLGTWQRIHEALCRRVRQQSGKKLTPSVAIVDSQSIRTAEGGEECGYDAGKKITSLDTTLFELAKQGARVYSACAVYLEAWYCFRRKFATVTQGPLCCPLRTKN
jgi:transposase